jgi:CubicO group peptidase (beta-lactamase class C family)
MREFSEVIKPTIADAIDSGRVVGTSIIVARHGKIIFDSHTGFADRENSKAVTKNTIFRLASMTKPIVSAAALALIENGILDVDAPISRWLPNFRPKFDGKPAIITIKHLLTHTAGFSYSFLSSDNEPYRSAGVSDGIDESVLSLDENLQRLAKVPLMFAPGSSWCYSLATDVLGRIMEKATGKPLPDIVEQYITRPLGMTDTTFRMTEKQADRLAKAYADSKPGVPARAMQDRDQVLLEGCGPIHYAPGRIKNTKAYPSGGAGMAGTAADYLKFLEAIRQGGHPILTAQSVALLTQDAVQGFDVPAAGPGYGFGLGFAVVRDSKEAGTPRSTGTYEWGGVYGTKTFVDPQKGLSVIILTNTGLEGLTGKFPVDMTAVIYKALPLIKDSRHGEEKKKQTPRNQRGTNLLGGLPTIAMSQYKKITGLEVAVSSNFGEVVPDSPLTSNPSSALYARKLSEDLPKDKSTLEIDDEYPSPKGKPTWQ